MNHQTDCNQSPRNRGIESAERGMMGESCDWNPETQEYNPYPKNTKAFKEYADAAEAASEYLTHMYPHV